MKNWLVKRKYWLILSVLLITVVLASSLGIHAKIDVGDKVITIGNVGEVYANTVDYTFNGNVAHDTLQMLSALNALPATGGRIEILNCSVVFNANITRAINNVMIEGVGVASSFTLDGINPVFTAGGNNWVFSNLKTDAGGISMGVTTGWVWNNVTIGATLYTLRNPSTTIIGGAITANTFTGVSSNATTASNSLLVNGYAGVRTATYVVAPNDALALVKAQADVVCDGVNDEVQLLASLTYNSGNQINVVWMPGEYHLGALLDCPPLERMSLFAAGAVLTRDSGDSVIRFDSLMNVYITGIIPNLLVANANAVGIDLDPRTVLPLGEAANIVESKLDFNTIAAAGSSPYGVGSIALRIKANSAPIIGNFISIEQIHGWETGVLITTPGGVNICRGNSIAIGHIFKVKYAWSDPSSALVYGNNIQLGMDGNITTTGLSVSAQYNTYQITEADAPAGNYVVFNSGAIGNVVRGNSNLIGNVTDNSSNLTNITYPQANLASIFKISIGFNVGRWTQIPTNAGWDTTLGGSGAVTQRPTEMLLNDGGVGSQNNTALARTPLQNLNATLSTGGYSPQMINFDKAFIIDFYFGTIGNDSHCTRRLQIKAATTEGALTAKGLGFVLKNLALYGESYGSSGADIETNLAVTLGAANESTRVTIIHNPGVSDTWYIDGVLKGTETDATKIPSGTVDNCLIVTSVYTTDDEGGVVMFRPSSIKIWIGE